MRKALKIKLFVFCLVFSLIISVTPFSFGLDWEDFNGNDSLTFKVDPPKSTTIYFDEDGDMTNDSNSIYWVQFTVYNGGKYLSFITNNVTIEQLSVKGGDAYRLYTDLSSEEDDLRAPDNNGGNIPEISHYSFDITVDEPDEPEEPEVIKGSLTITKIVKDHNDDVIDDDDTDFTFEIYKEDTDGRWIELDISPVIITGNDSVTIDDLDEGIYKVTEVDIPDEFTLDSANDQEFEIEEDGDETEVIFTNKKDAPEEWFGNIQIQKNILDESSELSQEIDLSGFEFELWTTGNNAEKIDGPKTTDENGIVEFENIPEGTYIIIETNSKGLIPLEQDLEIEVSEVYADGDTVYVEFNNLVIPSEDIVVRKLVEGDDDLSGFKFLLYRVTEEGEEFVDEQITDETGLVIFENQPDGEYVLYEENREGYEMGIGDVDSEDGYDFYHSNNMIYPIEITNTKLPTPILGEIIVEKIVQDSDGQVLEDNNTRFYFDLYMKGEGEDEWILKEQKFIDGNGTVSFVELEDGEYIVSEVDIDEDYILITDNDLEVEIVEGSTEEVEFTNELSPLPDDEDEPDDEPEDEPDDEDDDPDPEDEPTDEPDDEPEDDPEDEPDDVDEPDDEPEVESEEEILDEEIPEDVPDVPIILEIPEVPEEEEIVEEPVPESAPTLPKTGAANNFVFTSLGTLLLGLGIFFRKKE